ncbi:MAG: RagB/SusD family nutrient uptake outer membrane protein [Prevotella sp.]|nr:RagB/SusD family nutrient uptake outer membrane protein [Prevotella sp.]
MKKINIILGCLALGVMTMFTGCESLDQAPEDYFASGNFWTDQAQVSGYMTGLHSYLRTTYSMHFATGEIRGGLLGDGDDGTGVSVFGESMDAQTIIKQQLRADNAQFNNWNGLYAEIVRVNLAIQQIPNCTFLTDTERAIYLAQSYGMRAYYYFFLYRTWGGVPLVTDVAITEGQVSAAALSRPRAAASEIMKLIKADIAESEAQFAASGGDQFTNQYSWSLYATLMLKANVYAWAANVTTGDFQKTGNSDLQTARAALQQVIGSGKFSLMPEFYQAFRPDFKAKNTENILAVSYNTSDKVYMPYASNLCAQANFFTAAYDRDGNPLTLTNKEAYGPNSLINGICRFQYKESFWRAFDDADTRRDATFFPIMGSTNSEWTGSNFGLLLPKFSGHYETSEGNHYFDCDGPIFRYAEALLLMAEIENDLGADPSKYINQIRQRAYGDGYPAYTNQSQYLNTKAILTECDKEFVFEGKRWFNIQRMHDASGNALVFDASINYPYIPGQSEGAILSSSESYKLLWPVSVSTMTNDPAIEQTPGYE